MIVAIVTSLKDSVTGGAPTFIVTQDKLQETADLLEKILDAMVHQVNANTLIIVRH